MKLNLKSTITAPAGQTLNGIVGNTRRGIQVDPTLDPDSNNPVANKAVATTLAALAGKIDAALQKPTGLTKTKLVGVGTSGQENIEIGDNLTLQDGKLAAVGGKSVPPTLLLFDPETAEVRTSITQEEKTNLDNGLYNQVVYYVNSPLDLANPCKLIFLGGQCLFSQFSFTGNIDIGYSVASLNTYEITIETKNASGEYPITINKIIESPLSGGGGGVSPILMLSDSSLHARTTITKEEKINIEKKLYNSVFYYDASFYSIYLPEIVSYIGNDFAFSTYSISSTDTGSVVSGFNIYSLNISNNANEDGTYPITISKSLSLPLAGSNGGGINIATIEIDKTPIRENTPIVIIDTSMIKDDTQFVYIKDTSTNYQYMLYRVGDDFTNVWTDNIVQGETIDYLYLHINGNNATLYHFNSKLGTVTFED